MAGESVSRGRGARRSGGRGSAGPRRRSCQRRDHRARGQRPAVVAEDDDCARGAGRSADEREGHAPARVERPGLDPAPGEPLGRVELQDRAGAGAHGVGRDAQGRVMAPERRGQRDPHAIDDRDPDLRARSRPALPRGRRPPAPARRGRTSRRGPAPTRATAAKGPPATARSIVTEAVPAGARPVRRTASPRASGSAGPSSRTGTTSSCPVICERCSTQTYGRGPGVSNEAENSAPGPKAVRGERAVERLHVVALPARVRPADGVADDDLQLRRARRRRAGVVTVSVSAPAGAAGTSAVGEHERREPHRRATRYRLIMPRSMWSSTWQW